jgi:hypothetical protein
MTWRCYTSRDGNGFKTYGYRVYKPIPTRLIPNSYSYPHSLPMTGIIFYSYSPPVGATNQ